MLVITTGHGVNGFTLDGDIGEFILTHPKMTIPAGIAINSSNERFWEKPVQRYVEECIAGRCRCGINLYALGGIDGGRSSSHPDARWRLPVPQGHQVCSNKRRQAAFAV